MPHLVVSDVQNINFTITVSSSSLTLTLPILCDESISDSYASVDWGDGNIVEYTQLSSTNYTVSYTYASPDTYYIFVAGVFSHLGTNSGATQDTNLAVYQAGLESFGYQTQITELTNFSGAFAYCSALETATILRKSNNVVDMSYMFYSCTVLNSNGLKSLDTTSVQTTAYMFANCSAFNAQLDFDECSQLVNCSNMFANCTSMNDSKITMNLTSCTSVANMFLNAPMSACNITFIGDNTTNVLSFSSMFANNTTFNSIFDASGLTGVVDFSSFLDNCSGFSSGQVLLDLGNCGNNIGRMFSGINGANCRITLKGNNTGLKLDNMFNNLHQFNSTVNCVDLHGVISMSGMFANCPAFDQIVNASTMFDLSTVTNYSGMFQNCSGLNNDIDLTGSSAGTTFTSMFSNCSALNNATITLDLTSATDISDLFSGASLAAGKIVLQGNNTTGQLSLARLFQNMPLFNSTFDFSQLTGVTSMSGMLQGSPKFNQPIDGPTMLNLTTVTDLSFFMYGCVAFDNTLNLSNSTQVTNFNYAFASCIDMDTCTISLDLSSCLTLSNLFSGISGRNCTIIFTGNNTTGQLSLESLFSDLTSFNSTINFSLLHGVVSMKNMFSGCSSYNQPIDDTTMFDLSTVTDMSFFLFNCPAFASNIMLPNSGNVANFTYFCYNCPYLDTATIYLDLSNATQTRNMFSAISGAACSFTLVGNNTTNSLSLNAMFQNNGNFNSNVYALGLYGAVDCGNMFANCLMSSNTVELDLTKCVSVNGMFSGINGSQVTIRFVGNNQTGLLSFDNLFSNLQNFNGTLDFSQLYGVINTRYMFSNSPRFNQDVNFDTSLVTDMSFMFQQCTGLGASSDKQTNIVLDISSGPTLTNLFTQITGTFMNIAFTNGNPILAASNPVSMYNMFNNMPSSFNANIDLSQAKNISSLQNFLNDCQYYNNQIILGELPICATTQSMFNNCQAYNHPLKLAAPAVISCQNMFANCYKFNSDVELDCPACLSYGSLFQGCSALGLPRSEEEGPVRIALNLASCVTMTDQPFGNAPLVDAVIVFYGDNTQNISFNNLFGFRPDFNSVVDMSQLTGVGDFSSMFFMCSSFNKPVLFGNTSKVTNFSSTFYQCSAFNQDVVIASAPLCTDFGYMFYQCSAFNANTNIDVSAATNLSYMFYKCTRLDKNIALACPLATRFANCFDGCVGFATNSITLDLTSATDLTDIFKDINGSNCLFTFYGDNTTNLLSLEGLFANLPLFNSTVDLSRLKGCVSLKKMFYNCPRLNKNLSLGDCSQVTTVESLLDGCITFNGNLDFSGVDGNQSTSNCTNFAYMMNLCSQFNSPIVGLDTSKAQFTQYMFNQCVLISTPIVVIFNGIINTSYMFAGCLSLNPVVTFGDTSKLVNVSHMFEDVVTFNSPISITSALLTDASYLLKGALAFNSQLILNVPNVQKVESMLEGCILFDQPLTSDVAKQATYPTILSLLTSSNVTDFTKLMYGCIGFNSLLELDTSSAIFLVSMLENATSFNSSLASFQTNKVVSMKNFLHGASNFNQSLELFNMSSVTNCAYMIDGTNMSVDNYTATLNAWAFQSPRLSTNVTLGAGGLQSSFNYSTGYTILTTTHGWNIIDDGFKYQRDPLAQSAASLAAATIPAYSPQSNPQYANYSLDQLNALSTISNSQKNIAPQNYATTIRPTFF